MIQRMLACLVVFLLVFTMVPASAESGEQDNWVNILLLGGDSRSLDSFERTDAMIILSINVDTAQVKMTSIMRDTWVSFPGRSAKNKINAANVFGGPELSVATVNACFGTNIEDYVLINMTGLIKLIDIAGGIDIAVTKSEMEYTNRYAADYIRATLGGGSYDGATSLSTYGDSIHLNGLLALSFARNRYTDSDYGRVQRQQKVLVALAKKFKNMGVVTILKNFSDIEDCFVTSLDRSDMVYLAKKCMDVEIADVGQFRIPADGTFDSGMFSGTWEIRPDFEKNTELLHEFIYGAD